MLGFEGAVWEDRDFQEVLATMFTAVVGSDRDIGKAWQSMYDDQIMQRQDEPVKFFDGRLRRMKEAQSGTNGGTIRQQIHGSATTRV